ncbi:auxin-responsive protein SAUR22-like [Nymphaea colorata]|nr:auxin-responsive protein SAUR22-like [Nymphaea colorata]
MALLKGVVGKVQKKLSHSDSRKLSRSASLPRSGEVHEVKQGYFAVLAVSDGVSKRFMVPLSFLSNPAFLRLLDEAEEEYGYAQQSILTVLCHPSELESILAGQCRKERRESFPAAIFRGQW